MPCRTSRAAERNELLFCFYTFVDKTYTVVDRFVLQLISIDKIPSDKIPRRADERPLSQRNALRREMAPIAGSYGRHRCAMRVEIRR
jgi:hypothetical protein